MKITLGCPLQTPFSRSIKTIVNFEGSWKHTGGTQLEATMYGPLVNLSTSPPKINRIN